MPKPNPIVANPKADRAVRLAARRLSPSFLIFDADLTIVMRSPELELAGMLEPSFVEQIRYALGRAALERTAGSLAFHALGDEAVLRIVPLSGERSGSTAVFIERIEEEGSVAASAALRGLTRREAEVLGLLVRSLTGAEMAAQLSIAETTVADHVKSVMRKMDCSRRSELIARVYHLDHEIVPPLPVI
jgi:DNA-binding CsgD family transcriptional regulator